MKNIIATALLLSNVSSLQVKSHISIEAEQAIEQQVEADAMAEAELEQQLESDEVFEVTDVDPKNVQKENRPKEVSNLQTKEKKVDQNDMLEAVQQSLAQAKTQEEKDQIMSQAQAMMETDQDGGEIVGLSETDQLLAKQKAVEARATAQFERDKMPEKKDDAVSQAQPVQAKQVVAPLSAPVVAQVAAPIEAPVVTPVAAPLAAPQVAYVAPIAAPVEVPVEAPISVPVAAPVAAPQVVQVAAPVQAPIVSQQVIQQQPVQVAQQVQQIAPVQVPAPAQFPLPTFIAPVMVAAQSPVATQPAPIQAAPVQKPKPIVIKPKVSLKKKVVIKKSNPIVPVKAVAVAQPKAIAVQTPTTDRKDTKVATFIDANVDKAMVASGEKTPVPDAPEVAADGTSPPPASKPAGVLKTSTTENEGLVAKAIANKGEDKKLMGASQIKKAALVEPKSVAAPAKPKADIAAEFEKAFIDVDEDQEEGSKPPITEEKIQTENEDNKKETSAKEQELSKLISSIFKMKAHLAKAKAALENHKKIEIGINALANTQHGLAKKELMMSVKRQEESINDLQKHVDKGEEQLSIKQTELKALQGPEVEKSEPTEKSSAKFAKKEVEEKSAVKKEPLAVAEASKKEAVSEFKQAEAQVEQKVEKLEAKALAEGIDIKSLTEKNNKLWEQKYNDTLKQYEKEMKETEQKYKQELDDKSLVFQQESNQLTEKHKAELGTSMKKYTDLKEDHDQQVNNLFENIGTLKFTKEMRFFKKQWDEQKVEKKRKKVAAAMANATKAWVSDGEKIE